MNARCSEHMTTTQDILAILRQMSDDHRKEFAARTHPTSMEIVGVTMPDIRILLKELNAEFKTTMPSDVFQLAMALIQMDVFECQLVGLELMAHPKHRLLWMQADQALQLEVNMDNWVSTDTYSTKILGPLWDMDQLENELFDRWAHDPSVWRRRLAVASCVGLFRNKIKAHHERNVQRTIDQCLTVLDDRSDMVVKAVSWALRSAITGGGDAIRTFMEIHDSRLAPRVKREVWNKLNTGLKSG